MSIKLTRPNFLLWKTQLMGLIENQEMLGILNGDISVPTQHITMPNDQTQEDNPDYRAWRRSDCLLRG